MKAEGAERNRASRKIVWGFVGFLLGFGAPAGLLFIRMALGGTVDAGWAAREVLGHVFFYAYLMLCTPVVFGVFGWRLGETADQLEFHEFILKSRMQVLENESMTDDVTGLYNHRHILEELDKEIERARRHRRAVCGMMIDIDGFKQVNDRFGHLVGDIVLREMAEELNRSIRKIDIIGRYGGDEFLVILPESNLENARTVAERLCRNVREHAFKTKENGMALTISSGLVNFADPVYLSPEFFIEKVDAAMFKAKSEGKNRIFSCDFAGVERGNQVIKNEEEKP